YFEGTKANLVEATYDHWEQFISGPFVIDPPPPRPPNCGEQLPAPNALYKPCSSTDADEQLTEDAKNWITSRCPGEPWFAYVAYLLFNNPIHFPPPPPANDPNAAIWYQCSLNCPSPPYQCDNRACYKAMVGQLDRDVGQLLDLVDFRDRNYGTKTVVIFL